MKILYGAGNFTGSNIALSRFLKASKEHDVRTAAHYRNHRYLKQIDWCLDAIYEKSVGRKNYFKKHHGVLGPHIKHDLADEIINDLWEWEPDLVISDCEFFTAMAANALEVPLWYCSPMLQLTGIEHDRKAINSKLFDKTRSYIESLPEGSRYLVYSSLCDVSSRPLLKSGYEWVQPYSTPPQEPTSEDFDTSIIERGLSKYYWTSGEMSLVSDCMYKDKPFYIAPNPKDMEQMLNAQLYEWYGVARNIGRPQSISFIAKQVEKLNPGPTLSIQNWKQLDQKVNESSE